MRPTSIQYLAVSIPDQACVMQAVDIGADHTAASDLQPSRAPAASCSLQEWGTEHTPVAAVSAPVDAPADRPVDTSADAAAAAKVTDTAAEETQSVKDLTEREASVHTAADVRAVAPLLPGLLCSAVRASTGEMSQEAGSACANACSAAVALTDAVRDGALSNEQALAALQQANLQSRLRAARAAPSAWACITKLLLHCYSEQQRDAHSKATELMRSLLAAEADQQVSASQALHSALQQEDSCQLWAASALLSCAAALLLPAPSSEAVRRAETVGAMLQQTLQRPGQLSATALGLCIAHCGGTDDGIQQDLRAFWAGVVAAEAKCSSITCSPLLAMESAVLHAVAQNVVATGDSVSKAAGAAMLAAGRALSGWPAADNANGSDVVINVTKSLVASLSDLKAHGKSSGVLQALHQAHALHRALRASGTAPAQRCGASDTAHDATGSDSSSDDSSDDSESAPPCSGEDSQVPPAVQCFVDQVSAALLLAASACGWQVTAEVVIDSLLWPALEASCAESNDRISDFVHDRLGVICTQLVQQIETSSGVDSVARVYVADVRDGLEFVS